MDAKTAYTWGNDGKTYKIELMINMYYWNTLKNNLTEANTNFDRIIAHELTHAVMDANVLAEPVLNSMPRFLSQNLEDRLKCELMEEGMFVAPWCKIQRRDFLLEHKIQFPLTTLNGDVLFQIAEFCMSKKIQVIDACGYVWRIHSNQTIRSAFEKLFRKVICSMPIALEYLHEIFASPDLIEPMSQQTFKERKTLIAQQAQQNN